MNRNDANHVSKSLLLQQRRTQSVDEHPLKRLDGELFGENGQRMNKGISDGSCDIIEECNDICGYNVPTRNAAILPSGVSR